MKYLPIALFIVPGLLHAVMLPVMAQLGVGVRWQDWLTPQADGLYHVPGFSRLGHSDMQGLVGHIVQTPSSDC